MTDICRFVINLAARKDRRAEMTAQLEKIGWQAQFFTAIQAVTTDGFPSVGARGCFLSHLAVLRQGLRLHSHVMIMEDDLNFVEGLSKRWPAIFDRLQERPWSIFYAGHQLNGLSDGLSIVAPDIGVTCAHFLLVNKAAVPIIVGGLETILSRSPGHPAGGPMHVDGAYSTIRAQQRDLETYAHSPSLGYQRASLSDIAPRRIYDRVSFLKPAVSIIRKAKRHFSKSN